MDDNKSKKNTNTSCLFKLSQNIEEQIDGLEKYNKSIEDCIINFENDSMGMINRFIRNEINKAIPRTTTNKSKGFKLNFNLMNNHKVKEHSSEHVGHSSTDEGQPKQKNFKN